MPSYSDVRTALLQIGVDIDNPDSIEAFNDAIDEARRLAKRRKWWEAVRMQVILGLVTSTIAGLGGAVATWWSQRPPGGHP